MNLENLYIIEKQRQFVERQQRERNIPAMIRFFSREYRDAKRERRSTQGAF